jgi:hypothetical protein
MGRLSVRQRRKQHSCVEIVPAIRLCAAQYFRTQGAAYSCTMVIENFPICYVFMLLSQLSYVTAPIPDQGRSTYVAVQEHRTP